MPLQGSIPLSWGSSGSFPNLQKLSLSFNNDLSGALPDSWGSDGSSLQNLTTLNMTNCRLSGSLPKDWAGNLPALTILNLSANGLSGKLLLMMVFLELCCICCCLFPCGRYNAVTLDISSV